MTDPTLSHVKILQRRENLRVRVTNALRAAVISGEMRPGELYSAPTLGARFGVSPTPVREAMLDLVREGLVVSLPNKGFRVTEVSDKDLEDMTRLRLLLEPPVVRQVATVIPLADLPALRALAEKIVTAAAAGNLIEYVDADRVFHLTLLGYSNNQRLLDIVSSLRAQTRLLGLRPLVESGQIIESAREHHEILDAIEAGASSKAEQVMRTHIGHVLDLWAANPEPVAPSQSPVPVDVPVARNGPVIHNSGIF